MAEYKVQFEVYESPLDILLYLVRKHEVDIYQVNLARLAAAFIQYIEQMWDGTSTSASFRRQVSRFCKG